MTGQPFSQRYAAGLFRFRWAILAVTLVLAGLAAWQAPRVISRASTQFDPPAGSLAAQGDALLDVSFPLRGAGATQLAVFVEGAPDSNASWIGSAAVASFSRALNASLSGLSVPSCGAPCVQAVAGYWALRDMGLPSQAWQPFASAAGNATFVALAVNVPFSTREAIDFALLAQELIAELAARYLGPQDRATLLVS
jgi:hypothetical protein